MPTWTEILRKNPQHSEAYAARWRRLAAEGNDIFGEARLVDALAARRSRILDAGCGTGRIAGWLARRGHDVVGVDIDPVLIGYAKTDYPDVAFEVADLESDPLPEESFDIVVSAGNVMGFLSSEGRLGALRNMGAATRPGGRLIIGFGAGRGWEFADFLDAAREIGLRAESLFESWDLCPFTDESRFLVALLRRDRPGLGRRLSLKKA